MRLRRRRGNLSLTIALIELSLAADAVPFAGKFSYSSGGWASARGGTAPLKRRSVGRRNLGLRRTVLLLATTVALLAATTCTSRGTGQTPRMVGGCPPEASGNIGGRVIGKGASSSHVVFLMSDDATVDVAVASDGSFSLPCVYPSATYRLCVRVGTVERCENVRGPDARSLELSTPR
jgi:hypothetical protein